MKMKEKKKEGEEEAQDQEEEEVELRIRDFLNEATGEFDWFKNFKLTNTHTPVRLKVYLLLNLLKFRAKKSSDALEWPVSRLNCLHLCLCVCVWAPCAKF